MREFVKVLPLGLLLPLVIGAASVKPDDAISNISDWAHRFGFDGAAKWLADPAADNRVIAGSLGVAAIYAFMVWTVPAIRERRANPQSERLSIHLWTMLFYFLCTALVIGVWRFVPAPPTPPIVVPTQATPTIPTPQPQLPRLLSTYQKIIIVCDSPKPEKGPSKKERQEKLDQYVDLMKKVFSYTVKAKTTEDEITLDITPDKPIGDPTASIVRQAWLIKRAGDQLFVTVTNEYVGPLSFMLAIAQPDAADATMKSIVGQVEKFVSAEQGKCKPI